MPHTHMQAPNASSVAVSSQNPLLDDTNVEGSGPAASNSHVLSAATASQRAATAHGASEESQTSASGHERDGHSAATHTDVQSLAEQQRQMQAPFDMHTHAGQGGKAHREAEGLLGSSRTNEEASISHMASREGRGLLPGSQDSTAAGNRSAGGAMGSGVQSVSHTSDVGQQQADHTATLNEAALREQQLHSSMLIWDEATAVDSSDGAYSRLERAGQSADVRDSTGDMKHASSMDRLMQHADVQSSAQDRSARAGGDAQLDLRWATCPCVLGTCSSVLATAISPEYMFTAI